MHCEKGEDNKEWKQTTTFESKWDRSQAGSKNGVSVNRRWPCILCWKSCHLPRPNSWTRCCSRVLQTALMWCSSRKKPTMTVSNSTIFINMFCLCKYFPTLFNILAQIACTLLLGKQIVGIKFICKLEQNETGSIVLGLRGSGFECSLLNEEMLDGEFRLHMAEVIVIKKENSTYYVVLTMGVSYFYFKNKQLNENELYSDLI